MASLRVFVSSTCYDLSAIRSQIRSFIFSLGYEPIMSDYNDVLYDPRIHTHTSCIEEVNTCDLILLIVGSRFGGRAIPEAISKIDFETIFEKSKSIEKFKTKENISVTQLEILKAVEMDIPVFTFIDSRLYNDHELYEKNKGKSFKIGKEEQVKDLIKLIDFPSIDKPETAEFIFEFINFLRHRTKGNSINTFTKFEDIESTLKKQWSGLFQRLLNESRIKQAELQRIDTLTNQFEDLKTAILTSITNTNERDVAKGVVRFRKLHEFVSSLKIANESVILDGSMSWDNFLHGVVGVVNVIDMDNAEFVRGNRMTRVRTLLVKEDDTFYELRLGREYLDDISLDFEAFVLLSSENRKIIFDALAEMPHSSMNVRYRREDVNDYVGRYFEKNDSSNLSGDI